MYNITMFMFNIVVLRLCYQKLRQSVKCLMRMESNPVFRLIS